MEQNKEPEYCSATITHIAIGKQVIAVADIPKDWRGSRQERIETLKQKSRDYCYYRARGGQAMSLVEFENSHPHIELGYN